MRGCRQQFTRRSFLVRAPAAGLAAALPLVMPTQATGGDARPEPKPSGLSDKGPRLDLSLVQQFVGAAHRDLERVRELLTQHPTLINAAHDWGGGDWETALGAAAHVGRRNIALFLLERNARLDVFAAAMLGRLHFVKAAVTAFPGLPNVPGPHGIPLIKHAEAGGSEAREVLDYLKSLQPS